MKNVKKNLELSMLNVQEMNMDEMQNNNGGSGNEFSTMGIDAVLGVVLFPWMVLHEVLSVPGKIIEGVGAIGSKIHS